MIYPKELYKDGSYIVVWGVEEHTARLAEGWADEKPVEPSPELLTEPKRRK